MEYLSTLGPLLYILYVNDCFEKVVANASVTVMYADDTVLLSLGECFDDVMTTYQILFDCYTKLADVNCLNINMKKTKQMILCTRSKNCLIIYSLVVVKDQEPINRTSDYMYLGVNVDQNLCFDSFLKSTIQKVNFKLYLFSKI